MKKLTLIFIFNFSVLIAHAQKATVISGLAADTLVFTKVDHEPEFRGGMKKFWQYVAQNIRYPKDMGMIDVQGKVFVQFIVEKDGSISHAKVVKSLYDELDKEALRVINNSPKWKAGVQNKHIVRVYYVLPIDFRINDE